MSEKKEFVVHPEYKRFIKEWTKCRDCMEGQHALKAKKKTYLPCVSGLDGLDYEAYLTRAYVFGAMAKTVAGLKGSLTRKKHKIEFPERFKDTLTNITSVGTSIDALIDYDLDEMFVVGRQGFLIGSTPGGRPYVTPYPPEKIINWKRRVLDDGTSIVTHVVLKEEEEVIVDDVTLKTMCIPQWRQLRLVDVVGEEKPVYEVRVFQREMTENGEEKEALILIDTQYPRLKNGQLLNRIPFEFQAADELTDDVKPPPLLGVVDAMISHYQNSADLEWGRHWTALPMPWAAGFDVAQKPQIGSSSMYVSDNPQANMGMLEFTGAGLNHLQAGLKQKEMNMALLGSRMLEDTKSGVEAAEAVRLRMVGDGSALVAIADAASTCLTEVLRWVHRFLSPREEELETICVKINTDVSPMRLDAASITALGNNVLTKLMSHPLWFKIMQRGEIIPDDVTYEEETAAIDDGGPWVDPPPGVTPEPGMPAGQTAPVPTAPQFQKQPIKPPGGGGEPSTL